jgi:Protein kinase domain
MNVDIYCTRPTCPKPVNSLTDIDNISVLKKVPQKYCMTCGMPLILDGRYVPLKQLARGGFGSAYLACDRRTPAMRECVVKQLQPSGNFNPEQMQKMTQLFHREAAVLENLGSHQSIPELFAFFALQSPQWQLTQPQELFYLVQQYICGEDLEKELARKGKFSEAEVLEVLQAILPILQFVHSNDSIHRDIKPSNIMRDRDGLLYLVDFGAVKQVVVTGTKTPGVNLSNMPSDLLTGIFTPGFAPPEQTACLAVYPSTDLYALAATSLYLLTGKLPKSLIDPGTRIWNWRSHQVKVSDRLAKIIERMLRERPSDRFQSAKEVLDTLTRTANDPFFDLLNFEWLTAPFFTGFEVGLLWIFLVNLLPASLSTGLVGMTVGGMVYAQHRRIIEKKHLFIIVGGTLVVGLLFLLVLPPLLKIPILNFQLPNNFAFVAFLAILVGVFAVALTALSQLIYQLLIRII